MKKITLMIRTFIALVALFVLAATQSVISNKSAKAQQEKATETTFFLRASDYKHPIRIACVGDSITEGAGSGDPNKSNYPAVLGRLLGSEFEVKNFGVSGTTMLKKGDNPYWNVPAFVQSSDFAPDAVVIMLGTNDSKSYNWQHKDEFAADTRDLIAHYAGLPSKPKVWLALPAPVTGNGAFGITNPVVQDEVIPIERQVAIATDTPIIDINAALKPHPELILDTVHPTPAGHALIARTMFQGLTGALPANSAFETPLTVENLDPTAFTQWVDGVEKPMPQPSGPQHVIWTQNSRPELEGVSYGDTKTLGKRHLRIGFKSAITVGSVLVGSLSNRDGAGQLSVLKPDAAYPGDLNDDSQWIPAQRLKGSEATSEEGRRKDYYITWVLPSVTSTRALRFSHTPMATDFSLAGWLGGAFVLSGRVANLAPQGQITTRGSEGKRVQINDENDAFWDNWSNGDGASQVVSPENPEWIILTWPKPVTLRGLSTLWTGFGTTQVQTYSGPADRNPRDAGESDWTTIKSFSGLHAGYPYPFWPNWMDFGQNVTTRVLRLRIDAPATASHPHLEGSIKGGKRIWLGELMALQDLGTAELKTAVLPAVQVDEVPHGPIPIRFTLPEAAYVTLVIEGQSGKRVRNLVSETHFPAGENVVWWDVTDDLGRDVEAAQHGLYNVPGAFVEPGAYKVRGLYHKKIDVNYEFSIYSAGNPAWDTTDLTGGWLANHSASQASLFVPDGGPKGEPTVIVGSYITEGGTGVAWLDLNGRKQTGKGWIGGAWTGAPFLARDAGNKPVEGIYAYAAAFWDELRLTALTRNGGEKPVLSPAWKIPGRTGDNFSDPNAEMGGIAVRNGVLVASLTRLNQLLFVDVAQGKVLGTTQLAVARGLAFDAQGRLTAISGKKVVRFTITADQIRTLAQNAPVGEAAADKKLELPAPQTIVTTGLQDPWGITLDTTDNIYISDRGTVHQVKIFAHDGKPLHTIGKAGVPKAGPYDELRMNNPHGLTIDSNKHLWVTENDIQPKRVSVWTLDGKLVNAFYGPAEYGGGGTLDPKDKTRFYYLGMEFKLDWQAGKDKLTNIYYRPTADESQLPEGYKTSKMPQSAIYVGTRQYMANSYNSDPVSAAPIVTIWQMKTGIAMPVAAMGRVSQWNLLQTEAFRGRWPLNTDPKGDFKINNDHPDRTLFAWSDLNDDNQVQPAEVIMKKVNGDGFAVMDDLSILVAVFDDKVVRFKPTRFTAGGAPVFDIEKGETLVNGAQGRVSTGGGQALASPDGWTVSTNAPLPYSPYGMGGSKNGVPLWSYPSMWPGLHAAHEAPPPDRSGQLIGTTRLLGGIVAPKKGEAGPIWGINANFGNMYLFTTDGLFVSQLFEDIRQAPLWLMPTAQRGMSVDNLSLKDETFWPSMTQTADGEVYITGNLPNVIRVSGLDTIRRIAPTQINVTTDDLKQAQTFVVEQEAKRQQEMGSGILQVSTNGVAPTVDGNLQDWREDNWTTGEAKWVTIDKRGVAANFNSNSQPYNVTATVAVAGDKLYAAYKTGDANLLNNSGESAIAPFKTGGALDLMIGSIEGGARLLVTQVKGKTLAVLYRPRVPGTTTEPIGFSSPWRTIKFDRVDDVSDQIQLAADGKGNYEISAPLSLLEFKPQAGQSIKGDIGILRGNGTQTVQRVYWSNKATGITADVPSEAELTPKLWGQWQFRNAP